jgi:hypothetical protein
MALAVILLASGGGTTTALQGCESLAGLRDGVMEASACGVFIPTLLFFLPSIKTISFTFAASWPILL